VTHVLHLSFLSAPDEKKKNTKKSKKSKKKKKKDKKKKKSRHDTYNIRPFSYSRFRYDDGILRNRSRSRQHEWSRSVSSSDNFSHDDEPHKFYTTELTDPELGYLIGKKGAGVRRIKTSTGCTCSIHGRVVEIGGSKAERRLGRLCLEITIQLQQRNEYKYVKCKKLVRRPDVSYFDVPVEVVGYILGTNGGTIRGLQDETNTYMFFTQEVKKKKKKTIIHSWKKGI